MSTTIPHSSRGGADRRPVAATIAVAVHRGQILLVRRANPTDAALRGFPDGKIDPGARIERAAVRALLEETGGRADPVRVFTAADVFDDTTQGRLDPCGSQHSGRGYDL